jgi:hypothetical protein
LPLVRLSRCPNPALLHPRITASCGKRSKHPGGPWCVLTVWLPLPDLHTQEGLVPPSVHCCSPAQCTPPPHAHMCAFMRHKVLTVEANPSDSVISPGGYGNAKRIGHDIDAVSGFLQILQFPCHPTPGFCPFRTPHPNPCSNSHLRSPASHPLALSSELLEHAVPCGHCIGPVALRPQRLQHHGWGLVERHGHVGCATSIPVLAWLLFLAPCVPLNPLRPSSSHYTHPSPTLAHALLWLPLSMQPFCAVTFLSPFPPPFSTPTLGMPELGWRFPTCMVTAAVSLMLGPRSPRSRACPGPPHPTPCAPVGKRTSFRILP